MGELCPEANRDKILLAFLNESRYHEMCFGRFIGYGRYPPSLD